MPLESPRIADLRRRVEADPASIAFAQLAEEYRRAGNYQAAEECCRAGLARHPGYLSARVTLGRALIELGKLDEAVTELESVLKGAPDNLAAIRGMAEIHQRRGNLEAALEYYRRALPLARHDPELEETVNEINRALGGATRPAASGLSLAQAESEILSAASRMVVPTFAPDATVGATAGKPAVAPPERPRPAAPAVVAAEPEAPVAPDAPAASTFAPGNSVGASADKPAFAPSASLGAPADKPDFDAPIDFDALLRSLSGGALSSPPPMVESLLSEPEFPAIRPEPVLPELAIEADAADPFEALERGLREFDSPAYTLTELDGEAPAAPPEIAFAVATPEAETEAPVSAEPAIDSSEQALLAELEAWLSAIKR